MTTQTQTQAKPWLGTIVPGYDIPVINERAVRAAAGLLFLGGAISYGFAIVAESTQPLKPFGMFFILDMLIRVGVGDRWSPSLALGRLIVIRQTPEWVGARQKEFAWWLGFGLALISCSAMGLLAAPLWITLALCGLCLSMLFLETAFGICVGCALQSLFDTTPPQYCPGGTCSTDSAHTHIPTHEP
ncbi:MAG: DUF4395 domain-containing protein [Microbacteriaceae bacterium]|nr:DUF4395 domain-containing protein [Microbacteriaceae bacterium]